MKILAAVLLSAIFTVSGLTQENSLITLFEQSGGTKTPSYLETITYCVKLASASPMVHYTTFGKSPQGRDLPLLIVDHAGRKTAREVKESGNAVLLIQACIHSGESDGKDAGFLLIRDLVTKPELQHLLQNTTILFIPIFNVDGHERFGPFNRINQNGPEEMGWRTTSLNLNLNRDYLKADAPEMQAWLTLFNTWNPDFFIDTHVTDGADYQYVLTYALETKGNMEKGLSDWTAGVCEPFLKNEMDRARLPIFPYVEFRRWHDPRSGLVHWTAPPMLSQGYTAARNRPGLLIESHMLKPYKQRVEATRELISVVLRLLEKEYKNLRAVNNNADAVTADPAFLAKPFALSWTESMNDSTMTDFLGFDYDIDTSDLTGGLWFKYNNQRPVTWKLPVYSHNVPEDQVLLPKAYVIPCQWTEVIHRLGLHGIQMKTLAEDTRLEVSVLHFSQVKWQQRSYEGHIKVDYQLIDSIETRVFPAGSVVIEMNQASARVIAHLLEPGSPDSFAAWGFFNTIMEQKEYFESYVMEAEARKMLDEIPGLREEFNRKTASDPKFAASPEAILRWFHSRSPWYDQWYNVYPVGRIFNDESLKLLSGKMQ